MSGVFDSESVSGAARAIQDERAREAAAAAAKVSADGAIQARYSELAREFIAHADAIGMVENSKEQHMRQTYKTTRDFVGDKHTTFGPSVLDWEEPVWRFQMKDPANRRTHLFRVSRPDSVDHSVNGDRDDDMNSYIARSLENSELVREAMLRAFASYELDGKPPAAKPTATKRSWWRRG